MIKSIDIRNYQSHKATRVEFAPGVNVLVGTSDSGKSAVIRTLIWVATNRPTGDAFRSTWGGETSARVELPGSGEYGDTFVARVKDGKKNEYAVGNDAVGTTDVFKALGQDVPDEIAAALNLPDVCVQHQMDSPFLLSRDWSPGRVAEYLNDVAGLDAIDRAQSGINAKIREITADTAREEAAVAAKIKERTALDYLQDLEKELVRVETASVQASAARRDEQALNAEIAAIASIEAGLATLPDYRQAERDINSVLAMLNSRSAVQDDEQALQTALIDISVTKAVLENVQRIAGLEDGLATLFADNDRANRLDDNANALTALIVDAKDLASRVAALSTTAQAERLLGYTREQVDGRTNAEHIAAVLEGLLGDIYATEDSLAHNGEELTALEEKWATVAPDVCPLCAGSGRLKPQAKLIDSEGREYKHGTSKG